MTDTLTAPTTELPDLVPPCPLHPDAPRHPEGDCSICRAVWVEQGIIEKARALGVQHLDHPALRFPYTWTKGGYMRSEEYVARLERERWA